MMTINKVTFTGNLVDDVKGGNTNDGKQYAYGKFGMYQGKDNQGNELPSLFFDFVVFGFDAPTLIQNGKKGMEILITGKFQETTSTGQNGQQYINKKVVADGVRLCTRFQNNEGQQYQQPINQNPQQYQQPINNGNPSW